MNIKINHLQHTGIPVTDLKKSETFYEAFGFKNVMSSTFQLNGNTGYVAMMKLNDIIIELYQPPEPELTEIRNRSNGHIDHIAFDVDDIDHTFSVLKQAGYTIMEPAPVFLSFWEKGCKYFNIAGPDGERLEFNQVL
ncbi:MAG: VOC family protein [Sphingobacteriales bacterium]|nr:VOC family protein [Sphingobacteriales bacterium]MBI3719724.1 VOC family protein [Sphingobacteriales bacterium]